MKAEGIDIGAVCETLRATAVAQAAFWDKLTELEALTGGDLNSTDPYTEYENATLEQTADWIDTLEEPGA